MASSGTSSACSAPSTDKDNFLRLSSLLIDGATKLLREVFTHINAPKTFDDVLAKSGTKEKLKKGLHKSEFGKIYPSGGEPAATLGDLDISLLFVLLRHTCNLLKPASGDWNKLPPDSCTGHADDLVRIKFYRNEVYAHVANMKLEDAEFSRLWERVKEPMLRLAQTMGRAGEWEGLIEQYRSGPLTSKEQEYVEELRNWCERERDLSDKVDQLQKELPRLVSESLQQFWQEMKGSWPVEDGVLRAAYGSQLLTERLQQFKCDVRPTLLLGHITCLNPNEQERIRAAERDLGLEEANTILVECLKAKRQGLHQFVGALRKSGNGHVALLLDPKGKIDTEENDDQAELDSDDDLLTIVGTAVDAKFHGTFGYNKVGEKEMAADLEAEIAQKYADASSSDTVELRTRLQNILPAGAAFVRTEKGSVACVIRISSLSGYEELFGLYKDNTLQTKLQEALLDATFKSEFQKDELVYDVNFSEERWLLISQKLKKFDEKEEENTALQKIKTKGSKKRKVESGDQPFTPPEFRLPKVFIGNDDELGTLELNLREYQKELAQAALQGKNSIICAPTNSGKTYVAVHIAKEHLSADAIRDDSEGASASKGKTQKSKKVAFIVNTVNLVAQQKEKFQIFLGSQYSVSDMSGAKSKDIPFKYLLQESNIVVMTAQILVNALKDKDNRVALSDISLLIFDECHHAQKEHPYNKVMEQYLALRLQPGSRHELPQVVGLTASLGVGDTDKISKAVEHILQICGNLDAEAVSTVQENREELAKYANTPERKVIMVSTRRRDIFLEIIGQVMGGIEKELGQVKPPPPRDRGSQAYRQWLEELYKTAVLEADRYMVTYVEQLRVYHVALDINSTLRMKDAMKSLEKYFGNLDEQKFTAVDRKLREHYKRAKKALEEHIRENGEPENPNLKQLEKLIAGQEASGDSKGIVFTATRESTQAMWEWVEDNDSLKSFLKPATIVGGGDSESGMTRFEQENAIKRFKDGEVNILLATNVAEEGLDISDCDYVIRYNVMGNEISSVQSRGRVRAKEGGKFFILAKQESGVLKRETLNKYRELLMAEAVGRVQKMDDEDFEQKVKLLQKKALDDRHFKKKAREQRQLEFQPGDVTFYCKKCKERVCQARHLRTIQESFRVIRPGILQDKVTIKPHPRRRKLIDNVEYTSKVHCGQCSEDWGVVVVIDEREWISLKVKSFLVEYSDGTRTMHKQWKDARFRVEEFSAGEEEEDGDQED